MSHDQFLLVIAVCVIVLTIVSTYKLITAKGLPGANMALDSLLHDKNRLDNMEYAINRFRDTGPNQEALVLGIRTAMMDAIKIIQQVQIEALKVGLVLPFNDESAKLLSQISKTTDVLTDRQPNVVDDVGKSG